MSSELRFHCPDEIHVPRTGKKDRKRKFYLNILKNAGHCFRCGYSTLDAKQFAERYKLPLDTGVVISSIARATRNPLRLPPEYTTDFTSSSTGRSAFRYLTERRITPANIAGYELGFCESGSYSGRVVCPFYESGALVSFQARDFIGRSDVERYIGPSARDGGIPNSMFNLDRPKGLMVLVEGPFDALRLPEFAIAIIGKDFNAIKLSKVLARKPKFIFLALDQDGSADEAREAIRTSLLGLVPHVEDLPFPGKDLGDLSEKELARVRSICQAVKNSL